mmetsp:Transcript_37340/g.90744  ORF Transcript_37340/g.90744 Transcript_37340/m.90744 type:complete len:135 (+) Transcript_37340:1354-1758(+)
MQRIGQGEAGAKTVSSFLGLSPGGLHNNWILMERFIATKEDEVTNSILQKNLEEEKKASPVRNGKPLLSIAMDCGWQKRGSGRRYNSSSGNHVVVGLRSTNQQSDSSKWILSEMSTLYSWQVPERQLLFQPSGV